MLEVIDIIIKSVKPVGIDISYPTPRAKKLSDPFLLHKLTNQPSTCQWWQFRDIQNAITTRRICWATNTNWEI